MDIAQLVVQVVIAMVCAGIANLLVPRRIPGKLAGLILIGLAGVLLGGWGFTKLRQAYGIDSEILRWQIEGVEIVPAIVGSAIVLYIVTTLLKWGRYQ